MSPLFGQDVLPFTANVTYQIVSFAPVAVLAAINAWYNNDFTKVALLCGRVFDAVSDCKITEEEVEELLKDTDLNEKAE